MKDKKVCVNLGCGVNVVPSSKEEKWINIDNFKLSDNNDFLKGDLLNIPLEKETADYIVCDQVLEHLKMSDVPAAMHEMKRILKKGGLLIIVVPDFESAVKQWLAVDHNMHFSPYSYQYLSEVLYGNQMHDGEYHKTPMCAGFLHYSLGIAGLHTHEILYFPTDGEIPKYPGIHYNENARLRNAQLVAVVTK